MLARSPALFYHQAPTLLTRAPSLGHTLIDASSSINSGGHPVTYPGPGDIYVRPPRKGLDDGHS